MTEREIWILSRWEGDYDVILGAYSTRDQAIKASYDDYNLNFKDVAYDVEYLLYHPDLDGKPEELGSQTITISKKAMG